MTGPWACALRKVRVASFTLSMMLAMSAAAACFSAPQRTAYGAPGSLMDEAAYVQRGLRINPRLLAFDHALEVRRSRNGIPHELRPGDTLMTGDLIRVSVRTSEDAYLYLAFCNPHELAVYPARGGVRTRAGEVTWIPSGGDELVVDAVPVPEVLYVILSRAEISVTGPQLSDALAAARRSDPAVACEAGLDALASRSAGAMFGQTVGKKRRSTTQAPNHNEAATSAVANPTGTESADAKHGQAPLDADVAPAPPVPDFERNVEQQPQNIVWYRPIDTSGSAETVAAGNGGIAVVRYTFAHVSPGSPP